MMSSKSFPTLAFGLVAGIGLTTDATALDGAALYEERACVSCHGPEGREPILPVYPKIAGQNADYAYAQLMDIRSGDRANGQTAAMRPILQAIPEEELRAIADWLQTLN